MPGELAADAIWAVATHIDKDNVLNVDAQDLFTFTNPRGKGVFAYVILTRPQGVKRRALWLVVENQALNPVVGRDGPELIW